MITITLKDGSTRAYEKEISVLDIAKDISDGLAKIATSALVNDNVSDLRYVITKDSTISILTFDRDGQDAYRHTSAHILAQAVKRLYPKAKLAIGPSIENGFYYDFDIETPFSTEDLSKIESEINKIIKENLPIERFTLSRNDAITFMENQQEPYKLELIKDLPEGEEISFYKQGEFTDLCAGPHLQTTGNVKAFKLLQIAGAYWRGSEKNKMLQRIYGTSFPKQSLLNEYVERLEEAKKRDHRKLGKELGLFEILEEGPGFPFFLPKGMVLRNILEEFWRTEHTKNGYLEVKTPVILSKSLWLTSGHWDHYKENMYSVDIDEQEFAIKPMNCPGGMLVYKRSLHSYRDLPLRMGELGLVHRHELSGALHGLMRVRCFTQDDAHIFMTPEQIKSEIIGVVKLIDQFYKVFGFSYNIELSTRPEESIGTDEQWDLAINGLKNALEEINVKYKINEGDGAFYGPKIDFKLTDCLGRTWQCGTIQLDMQLPERFDLTYVGQDGEKHRPIMIHRVVFGSMERFIAILTEHFAGAFPTWLSPVQIKILPLIDKHHEYALNLRDKLTNKGFRVEIDLRNEKIGYKIREAQLEKIPYMIVIGDKELENSSVSIRSRKEGDLGSLPFNEFLNKITEEVIQRTL